MKGEGNEIYHTTTKRGKPNWSELAMPSFRISEDVIVSIGDAKSVTSFIVKVD